MYKILVAIFIFSSILLGGLEVSAQSQSNIGFVKENIWYSKDPFVEGDKIKIYTLVFNPDARQFSGTINFFDDTMLLGKKDFKLAPQSSQVISIDWTATAGAHRIFAKIENAKFLIAKDNYEDVYLKSDETTKSTRTALKNIPIPELPDVREGFKEALDTTRVTEPIKNLAEKVGDSLPDFLQVPTEVVLGKIENFRETVVGAATEQQEKVEEQLGVIKIAKTPQEETKSKTGILKPFKYLELFLITLFTVAFETKWIFYSISFLFTILIIRYIWSRFF